MKGNKAMADSPKDFSKIMAGLMGGLKSGADKSQQMAKGLVDGQGAGFDLSGLLSKLGAGGLAKQVKSWVGTDTENQPVTPEQITEALGNEQVQKVADQAGITPEEAAQKIATTLPDMVDKMTPNGMPSMQGASAASGASSSMPSAAPSSSMPSGMPKPGAGGPSPRS
jgi:uncharacterized protein YidB (DUF937 family)